MRLKHIWIYASIISIYACQNKEVTTIISGKLPSVKNQTIMLVPINEYFPGLRPTGVNYLSTTADSTGQFTFKSDNIPSTHYQIIQANYHKLPYSVFLEKGDSIYIEMASNNNVPSLSISGKGAEKLGYLENDYAIFPKDQTFYRKIKSRDFATELDFKAFLDSISNLRIQAVEDNESIPDNLKSFFLQSILAENAMFLLEHLERRNYNMGRDFVFFYPEEIYYSILERISFDEAFCQTVAAKQLANISLSNKARVAFEYRPDDWWEEHIAWKFDYLSDLPKSDWTDLLTLGTITDYSMALDSEGFFAHLDQFQSKFSNNHTQQINWNLYQSSISDYLNLAPGQPAPDFALPDANDIEHRLSDFKGKIVYIDFWGTWCGPCVEELPTAIRLQEKYKNDPVVFLYIALEYDEKDIENWKIFISGDHDEVRAITNNQPLPGVHLVAEKQAKNENIRPYKINFAPTHVLIDQHGNIVNARAKRAKAIDEELDRVLMK